MIRVGTFLTVFLVFFLGTSHVRAIEIDSSIRDYVKSATPARVASIASEVLSKNSTRMKLRGASGARLFNKIAPSVVLIASEDSIGSGSIIDETGLILTNWHVVGENDELDIVFMPLGLGAEIETANIARAKTVSLDKSKDLALLQLQGFNQDLPSPLELASEEDIQIGLDTHAIGHPNGEFWTYTRGYISQYRPNYKWSYSENEEFQANVIQTQTPINPGNSGGPLINEQGKIIGVNSFKGQGDGINFAVALNEIIDFIQQPRDEQSFTPPPACESSVVRESRSSKDDGDVILFDRNCNEIADLSLYVPDDKTQDTYLDHDDNEDGQIDGYIVDLASDGSWDISYWDTDFDGKWDVKGEHVDGSLNPDRFTDL